MSNFSAYSKYYDLLYAGKDYAAEVNYVAELIGKYSPEAKTVIELGSGTGKHARLLAENGFKITGIERSAEMVELANRQKTANVEFTVGDITTFRFERKFAVAISLFHVISYITDNRSLLQTFRNTNAHLEEDGLFIFDVWYSPAVYHQKPETRIKRLSDDSVDVTRLAESVMHARKNIVDVNYEIIVNGRDGSQFEKIKEVHPMRHFSEPEIGLLAEQTGFEVIHTEEFLSGNLPGADTWGVCFILRKKGK